MQLVLRNHERHERNIKFIMRTRLGNFNVTKGGIADAGPHMMNNLIHGAP